jgi:hypothetical protein
MSEPIKLDLEIDLEALKDVVEKAKDLNDNEELFSQLVEVYRVKKQVGDILDQLTSIETEAKGFIKAKADAIYGSEWTAIKGKGYKITKSSTGSVFNILPDVKPPKQFLVIKESLDSKLVENFIKEKGKLPKGIEYNPSRGSSIRVTVNE